MPTGTSSAIAMAPFAQQVEELLVLCVDEMRVV